MAAQQKDPRAVIRDRTTAGVQSDLKVSQLEEEARRLHAAIAAGQETPEAPPTPAQEAEAESQGILVDAKGQPTASASAAGATPNGQIQPQPTPDQIRRQGEALLQQAKVLEARMRAPANIASGFLPLVFNTYAGLVMKTQDKDVSALLTLSCALLEIGDVLARLERRVNG